MIEVKPFNLDMLRIYSSFYCLQKITNVEQIDVFHETPSGRVEYNKINAFSMPNGRIIVAWSNPINMAQFYNFTAVSNGVTEIISTNSIDRVIDIYNKQTDSNIGIFSFANSNIVLEPNVDWRCDTGKYGPGNFPPNLKIAVNPQDIVIFEPILSVVGSAHLIYLEYKQGSEFTDDHLNNAEKPVIGRTLWECLKLIREWSITNTEPFNNNEEVAKKAFEFMSGLDFSNEDLNLIDTQTPMQIEKYLSGDNNARRRPDDIFEMNDDIRNIIFRKLSSGTFSALEYLNPGMWNLEELITLEKEFLNEKRNVFNMALVEEGLPNNYINLQYRLFDNRELILSKIENGEF